MPSADFDRSLQVPQDTEACWRVLTDIEQLVSWVSVAGEVHEETHLERYRAVLVDQFGPFKLKAELDIVVTDVVDGTSIAFRAKGEDRQVATSIVVDGALALEAKASGTTIHVKGRWSVIGTVATMGSGTIRKKADAIMEEFFAAAATALG